MSRRWKIQDPLLFAFVAVATGLGLVFIFDAGYARAIGSGRAALGALPPEFLAQVKFLPLAIGLGVLAAQIRPERWRRWATPLWLATLALLLIVKEFGTELNGAKRWLPLGPIGVQPAELAKFATILYLAAIFADRKPWPEKIKPSRHWADWLDRVAVPKIRRALPAILVLVGVYWIEKEPDLGTAAVVAFIAFVLMAVGGISRKSLLAVIVLGLGGGLVMVKQESYRLDRFKIHASRWSPENIDDLAYQTVQSEIAMASGGVAGVGFGSGRAKHLMPATTTDFINATIAEETGFLGAFGVLCVLGAIVWRLLYNAQRAPTEFGKLVLVGTASWVGVQTTVNFMMANALLPAIGIPIPLISSGGSSLLALWVAFGACQAMLRPQLAVVKVEKEDAHAAGRDRRRDGRAYLSGA